MKWHWKGKRLVNKVTPVSLSVYEAFGMQVDDPDIAKACKGILKPNTKNVRRFISSELSHSRKSKR